MDKLPEDFKKKWIDALRSGQFEQGRFALESHNKFCCLGVACKVVDASTYKDLEERGKHEIEFISTDEDKVPKILRGETEVSGKLANMNDGQNGLKIHSFSEIADWIDQNL